METYYSIEQGDCLANITEAFGFSGYRVIWEHPANSSLRERRASPNVLCVGDKIYIPERESKTTDGGTAVRHKFVTSMPAVWMRIVIQDDGGKPINAVNYRLTAGAKQFEGTTGSDGRIAHPIKPGLQSATLDLSYQKSSGVTVRHSLFLKPGHLDDVETPSGVQARLNNLGFDAGKVDGVAGPKTEAAIRSFQAWAGLEIDGAAGITTQAKLKLCHGC